MDTLAGQLLVVDDEEFNRLMISSMLTRLGYRVSVATNGESRPLDIPHGNAGQERAAVNMLAR